MKIRIVESNVNFSLSSATHASDILEITKDVDIALFQEVKSTVLRNVLDPEVWHIDQSLSDKGRQGVAVVFRKSIGRVSAASETLGVWPSPNPRTHARARMLGRYIFHVRLRLTNGKVLNLYSLHLPPARYAWLQGAMGRSLIALAGASRNKVIGADWNQKHGTEGVGRALRLRAVDGGAGGVCRVLLARALKVITSSHVRTHSDHPATFLTIDI